MKLTNRLETPPGGFRYLEMETGYMFEETCYNDLKAVVSKHREYKGLSTDNVEELIDAQICLMLESPRCRRGPDDTPMIHDRTHALSAGMLLDFNRVLFEQIKAGAKWEEIEEVKRRQAICKNCPLNKALTNCACSAFYKVIEKLIPEGRQDEDVSVCAACGCSMNAKANLTWDVLEASANPDLVFPPWCWQCPATNEGVAQTDKM